MKISALLTILLLGFAFMYLRNKPLGQKLFGHFYFQTLLVVLMVTSVVSKLIHFRLTLPNLLMLVILVSLLYLSLPAYLIKLRQRIRK